MEQFGRYELRRRLGVGGMAEVYEAVAIAEHGIEKPLVIKRILEEHSSDRSFQEMFRDEARVAMRLNHPNVVQVFDFGKADDGRYFLAMELVRGRDLAGIIARAKQQDRIIPAGVAIFIAGEAAKGLDHAHRLSGSDGKPLGIVHRDVSPQNILISTEGAVKVGDFGIAKFNARAGKTQVATVRGKVRYMSPEQAEGNPLDPRSDLFSLAIVLYEMITGKYAFDGRTDLDVLDAVRACSPKRPSEITNVPSGLERILMQALSRDPKHRYARGNEFQRELESFAVDKGLRATSGALAEFLNSLFPEIESRSSASDGVTNILKLPDGPKKLEPKPEARTRMRRVVAEDGMPVFVSEEVKLDPEPDSKPDWRADTRESTIRREDEEGDTRRAGGIATDITGPPIPMNLSAEVTATREASSAPIGEIGESTVPPGMVPRGRTRDGETVVGARPAPASQPTPGRGTSSDMRRPSQIVTPPRGTPRPPPAASAGGRATSPDHWRRPADNATMPAPPRAAPPPKAAPPVEDVDDEPVSRATFERAQINPLVADSLRERARDPLYIRVVGVAGAVLVLGFFGFRLIQPHLPGNRAQDGGGGAQQDGSLSVKGRTGDYVRVFNMQDEPVYQMSFPFGSIPLAPGSYKITVEGPGNEERPYVADYVTIEAGKPTIFNAARHAPGVATPEAPEDAGGDPDAPTPPKRRSSIP